MLGKNLLFASGIVWTILVPLQSLPYLTAGRSCRALVNE